MPTKFEAYKSPYMMDITKVLQKTEDKEGCHVVSWQVLYVSDYYRLTMEVYTWVKRKKKKGLYFFISF